MNNQNRLWIGHRLSDGLLFALHLKEIDRFYVCECLNNIFNNNVNVKYKICKKNHTSCFDIDGIIDNYTKEINFDISIGYSVFPYYLSKKALSKINTKNIPNRSVFSSELSREEQFRLVNNFNKITTPKFFIPSSKTSWEEIKKVIGSPIICQYDNTSSGTGTFLISNDYEYSLLIKTNGVPSITTQFIEDAITCSTHIFISDNKNVIFQPSVQIIETAQNNQGEYFRYKGNDFASYFKYLNNTEINMFLNKVAKCYRDLGIRGLLGIDFIVSKMKAYYIETNFRIQNSTSLLSYLQLLSDDKNNIADFAVDKSVQDILTPYIQGFQYYITVNSLSIKTGYYDSKGNFLRDFNHKNRVQHKDDEYLVFASHMYDNASTNLRIIGLGKALDESNNLELHLEEFIEALIKPFDT